MFTQKFAFAAAADSSSGGGFDCRHGAIASPPNIEEQKVATSRVRTWTYHDATKHSTCLVTLYERRSLRVPLGTTSTTTAVFGNDEADAGLDAAGMEQQVVCGVEWELACLVNMASVEGSSTDDDGSTDINNNFCHVNGGGCDGSWLRSKFCFHGATVNRAVAAGFSGVVFLSTTCVLIYTHCDETTSAAAPALDAFCVTADAEGSRGWTHVRHAVELPRGSIGAASHGIVATAASALVTSADFRNAPDGDGHVCGSSTTDCDSVSVLHVSGAHVRGTHSELRLRYLLACHSAISDPTTSSAEDQDEHSRRPTSSYDLTVGVLRLSAKGGDQGARGSASSKSANAFLYTSALEHMYSERAVLFDNVPAAATTTSTRAIPPGGASGTYRTPSPSDWTWLTLTDEEGSGECIVGVLEDMNKVQVHCGGLTSEAAHGVLGVSFAKEPSHACTPQPQKQLSHREIGRGSNDGFSDADVLDMLEDTQAVTFFNLAPPYTRMPSRQQSKREKRIEAGKGATVISASSLVKGKKKVSDGGKALRTVCFILDFIQPSWGREGGSNLSSPPPSSSSSSLLPLPSQGLYMTHCAVSPSQASRSMRVPVGSDGWWIVTQPVALPTPRTAIPATTAWEGVSLRQMQCSPFPQLGPGGWCCFPATDLLTGEVQLLFSCAERLQAGLGATEGALSYGGDGEDEDFFIRLASTAVVGCRAEGTTPTVATWRACEKAMRALLKRFDDGAIPLMERLEPVVRKNAYIGSYGDEDSGQCLRSYARGVQALVLEQALPEESTAVVEAAIHSCARRFCHGVIRLLELLDWMVSAGNNDSDAALQLFECVALVFLGGAGGGGGGSAYLSRASEGRSSTSCSDIPALCYEQLVCMQVLLHLSVFGAGEPPQRTRRKASDASRRSIGGYGAFVVLRKLLLLYISRRHDSPLELLFEDIVAACHDADEAECGAHTATSAVEEKLREMECALLHTVRVDALLSALNSLSACGERGTLSRTDIYEIVCTWNPQNQQAAAVIAPTLLVIPCLVDIAKTLSVGSTLAPVAVGVRPLEDMVDVWTQQHQKHSQQQQEVEKQQNEKTLAVVRAAVHSWERGVPLGMHGAEPLSHKRWEIQQGPEERGAYVVPLCFPEAMMAVGVDVQQLWRAPLALLPPLARLQALHELTQRWMHHWRRAAERSVQQLREVNAGTAQEDDGCDEDEDDRGWRAYTRKWCFIVEEVARGVQVLLWVCGGSDKCARVVVGACLSTAMSTPDHAQDAAGIVRAGSGGGDAPEVMAMSSSFSLTAFADVFSTSNTLDLHVGRALHLSMACATSRVLCCLLFHALAAAPMISSDSLAVSASKCHIAHKGAAPPPPPPPLPLSSLEERCIAVWECAFTADPLAASNAVLYDKLYEAFAYVSQSHADNDVARLLLRCCRIIFLRAYPQLLSAMIRDGDDERKQNEGKRSKHQTGENQMGEWYVLQQQQQGKDGGFECGAKHRQGTQALLCPQFDSVADPCMPFISRSDSSYRCLHAGEAFLLVQRHLNRLFALMELHGSCVCFRVLHRLVKLLPNAVATLTNRPSTTAWRGGGVGRVDWNVEPWSTREAGAASATSVFVLSPPTMYFIAASLFDASNTERLVVAFELVRRELVLYVLSYMVQEGYATLQSSTAGAGEAVVLEGEDNHPCVAAAQLLPTCMEIIGANYDAKDLLNALSEKLEGVSEALAGDRQEEELLYEKTLLLLFVDVMWCLVVDENPSTGGISATTKVNQATRATVHCTPSVVEDMAECLMTIGKRVVTSCGDSDAGGVSTGEVHRVMEAVVSSESLLEVLQANTREEKEEEEMVEAAKGDLDDGDKDCSIACYTQSQTHILTLEKLGSLLSKSNVLFIHPQSVSADRVPRHIASMTRSILGPDDARVATPPCAIAATTPPPLQDADRVTARGLARALLGSAVAADVSSAATTMMGKGGGGTHVGGEGGAHASQWLRKEERYRRGLLRDSWGAYYRTRTFAEALGLLYVALRFEKRLRALSSFALEQKDICFTFACVHVADVRRVFDREGRQLADRLSHKLRYAREALVEAEETHRVELEAAYYSIIGALWRVESAQEELFHGEEEVRAVVMRCEDAERDAAYERFAVEELAIAEREDEAKEEAEWLAEQERWESEEEQQQDAVSTHAANSSVRVPGGAPLPPACARQTKFQTWQSEKLRRAAAQSSTALANAPKMTAMMETRTAVVTRTQRKDPQRYMRGDTQDEGTVQRQDHHHEQPQPHAGGLRLSSVLGAFDKLQSKLRETVAPPPSSSVMHHYHHHSEVADTIQQPREQQAAGGTDDGWGWDDEPEAEEKVKKAEAGLDNVSVKICPALPPRKQFASKEVEGVGRHDEMKVTGKKKHRKGLLVAMPTSSATATVAGIEPGVSMLPQSINQVIEAVGDAEAASVWLSSPRGAVGAAQQPTDGVEMSVLVAGTVDGWNDEDGDLTGMVGGGDASHENVGVAPVGLCDADIIAVAEAAQRQRAYRHALLSVW